MVTNKLKIPHGFIITDDGLWGEAIVRLKDGKSLFDCHRDGECPKECLYCQRAEGFEIPEPVS